MLLPLHHEPQGAGTTPVVPLAYRRVRFPVRRRRSSTSSIGVVTPQVFSSLIALHLHKHKHASFMLFYVVATNVAVFLEFCLAHIM
jgi:hypothetical protein